MSSPEGGLRAHLEHLTSISYTREFFVWGPGRDVWFAVVVVVEEEEEEEWDLITLARLCGHSGKTVTDTKN